MIYNHQNLLWQPAANFQTSFFICFSKSSFDKHLLYFMTFNNLDISWQLVKNATNLFHMSRYKIFLALIFWLDLIWQLRMLNGLWDLLDVLLCIFLIHFKESIKVSIVLQNYFEVNQNTSLNMLGNNEFW